MTPLRKMQARENALAVLRRLAGSAAGQAPVAAAGMIPVFVSKMRSGSDAQKATSAAALRDLAGRKENHAAIARTGGIQALVALAKDGDAAQRDVAIAALLALAENEDNSAQIVAAGGVDVLTACVQDEGGDEGREGGFKEHVKLPPRDEQSEQDAGMKSVELDERLSSPLLANIPPNDVTAAESHSSPSPANIPQFVALVKGGEDIEDVEKTEAASALFDLSASDANHAEIVAANGVPALVNLLRSGSKPQQTNAAGALMNLAKTAAFRPDILAADGVRALVQSMGYDESGTLATAALVNMAAYSPSHAAIVGANGISHLVCIMRSASSDALKLLTAMGLSVLARTPAAAKAIYSLGGASALFLLVRRGTAEQRTHAARALRKMAKAGVIDPKSLATVDGLTAATPTTHSEEPGCKRSSELVGDDADVAKRITTEP